MYVVLNKLKILFIRNKFLNFLRLESVKINEYFVGKIFSDCKDFNESCVLFVYCVMVYENYIGLIVIVIIGIIFNVLLLSWFDRCGNGVM